MTRAESTAQPALLVHTGEASHSIDAERGAVTIGREPQAGVQIDAPHISQAHLRAEPTGGHWRIVDSSPDGMFVDGLRKSSVTVTDKTVVRFGDPAAGEALTFEVAKGSHNDSDDHEGDSRTEELDPGMVRAGRAAAARRRELDISQRSLAAEGIINAGALIAFEKGRSWPRQRTRAKLEEVLRWPPGTIARIRRGEPVSGAAGTAPASEPPSAGTRAPEAAVSEGPATLIAQAVVAAVDGCSLAIAALPAVDDPAFIERAAPILADLRQLEAIAVRATRISRITPDLIRALGAVRRHHDELMMLGASAPGAPLAHRLYAARHRANLSTSETAQAAGLPEDVIARAEAGEVLPPDITTAIEALIRQIS